MGNGATIKRGAWAAQGDILACSRNVHPKALLPIYIVKYGSTAANRRDE
jgi:hypothetical protein